MTVAGVVVVPDPPSRAGRGARAAARRAPVAPAQAAVAASRAAIEAGLDEVVVVVADAAVASQLPEGATVLLDEGEPGSEAGAVRAALDWSARCGHDVAVVALLSAHGAGMRDRSGAAAQAGAWRRLAAATGSPVVLATRLGRPAGLVRIAAEVWPLMPLDGPVDALLRARPELVSTADLDAAPGSRDRGGAAAGAFRATPADVAAVERLLGRPAAGEFRVVVRDRDAEPLVIENAPLLRDGTPMPTRYWLVGSREREAVGRLEAAGGVRRAEAAVGPDEIAAAHARYAAGRDALLPAQHAGPAPHGGVGGTRTGVKCLHAHLAWYLAGGGDPVGRWVAGELAGELDGPVAAVDCGTNSTRLLVTDAGGATLERSMRITRLGAGVEESGVLAADAIERTLAVLRAYRDAMDARGVVRCRAIATSAARDARNSGSLLVPAEAVLGVPLELLSGDEEGELSYRGATAELDPAAGPYLVVDLGGGSTELVAEGGAGGSPLSVASLPVGCVRVTERFLASDPPADQEVAAAMAHVRRLVSEALEGQPGLAAARRMVGVAGTVSALAVLSLGLDRYDRDAVHHLVLARATVERLAAELLAQPVAERSARPGLERGRADVIAGGALVLSAVMAVTGHEELVVSESDILDGLVSGLRARR